MEKDFDRLVRDRHESLRRASLALVRNTADAEDLVQATWVKAYRARQCVLAAEDPSAYLHRILINTSRSWRRVHWPTMRNPRPADFSQDDYALVDDRLSVYAALRLLPRAQREAVVLRYLVGLTEREVATVLGCPDGTVKSRTSRGLAGLRTSLPRDSFEKERN